MPEFNYITDKIFTVSDFLTAQECDSHILRAEAIGFEEATVTTQLGPRMRKDIRNNTRVILDDETLASELWTRIADYVPLPGQSWRACGLNERLRYYRYDIGQRFQWHVDGSFERGPSEQSFVTFMVYLNDGFEGGETSFVDLEIVPKKGLALLFFHDLRHKGQPVLRGRKYVLRTDVMYRYISE